jgi:hypothetical protein
MALNFGRHRNEARDRRRRFAADSLPRSLPWRVIVLIGALVLVVFAMRAARRPENWNWMWNLSRQGAGDSAEAPSQIDTRLQSAAQPTPPAAPADGVLIPHRPAPWEHDVTASAPPTAVADALSPADAAARQLHRALWLRLLEQLAPAEKTCLLRGLKAARTLQPPEQSSAWVALLGRLDTLVDEYLKRAATDVAARESQLTPERQLVWQAAVQRVRNDWTERFAPSLRALVSEYADVAAQLPVLNELQAILDRLFLEAVVDNTVFRPGESDAWFRLLEQADRATDYELSAAAEPATFLQLYQQPEAYRGRPVTVRGTVRLVQHYPAPENLYGIHEYYALWLIPPGTSSPVVVYCLRLPEGFPQPHATRGARQSWNEDVEVSGYFFKRWAYRAVDRTRLAPLVLAKAPRWERRAAAGVARRTEMSTGMAIAVVGGTLLFAVAVVLVVYVQGQRSARMRHASRVGHGLLPVVLTLCVLHALSATLLAADTSVSDGIPDRLGRSEKPDQVTTARAMLELFGIGRPQLDQFVDGRRLQSQEEELLRKILYRLAQAGPDKLHAWQRGGADWADVAARPTHYRAEVLQLAGRAREVQRVALSEEQAARLGYAHYYCVSLELGPTLPTAIIYACAAPEAWAREAELNEPAGCPALLLKAGAAVDGQPELIFAAERVAWYPDRVVEEKGIAASHVLLGRLGMDVGLFDEVRKTNRRPLEAEDRECFYQLLAATGRTTSDELFPQASRLELKQLLTQPEQQHGRLVDLRGTALRVQKIAVESEAVRRRFGIDHYYEVDVLVPLGDEAIRLEATGAGSSEQTLPAADQRRMRGPSREGQRPRGPLFENSFPITCCTLHLPPGFPQEENLRQPVHLAGFYFKLWAYRSEYVSAFDSRLRQPSPLFIAATPRLVRASPPGTLWSWVGGVLLAVLLGGVVLTFWRMHRSDREYLRRARRRRESEAWGARPDTPSEPGGEGSPP